MGFWSGKFLFLVMFLLLAASDINRAVKASRPLSILPPQEPGVSKIFATMGIECKCCDGIGGKCTNLWTNSCSRLHCSPWKQF